MASDVGATGPTQSSKPATNKFDQPVRGAPMRSTRPHAKRPSDKRMAQNCPGSRSAFDFGMNGYVRGSATLLTSPNGGQLSLGRRRRHSHFGAELHLPARLLAHLLDAMTRMDRVQVCLPAAFGKSEHAQRRDDGHRASTEQPVAFAPA